MVSAAIQNLAGESSDRAAWNVLLTHFNRTRGRGERGYLAGEKVAVKLNLVTCYAGRKDTIPWVDPVTREKTRYPNHVDVAPQMAGALLRQLVAVVGVAQNDIGIGDTTAIWPNAYFDPLFAEFPEVHFVDNIGGGGRERAEFSEHPITWSTPAAGGATPDYLPALFANADYVINFAVLKGHSAGITGCGKNHYGSLIRLPTGHLRNEGRLPYYDLHASLPNQEYTPGQGHYRALVDLMGHPDLGGKTVLYLLDGLYGGYYAESRPRPWRSAPFGDGEKGDWPSSLFASQDPVAIDSVAHDFLLAEWPEVVTGGVNAPGSLQGGQEDYLHEAALAAAPPSESFYDPDGDGLRLDSLGVHEHWNNSADKQYSRNLGLDEGIELMVSALAPTSSLTDHVQNGGFELPVVTSGWFLNVTAGQTTIPGWTVVSGDVDVVRSEPDQWLDLNGWGAGEISQTILGAWGTATLSFASKSASAAYRAEVFWDGQSLGIVQHADQAPSTSTFTVSATGNDILRFKSLNAGAAGVYLDDVALITSTIQCDTGAPVFTAQPQPVVASLGGSASFSSSLIGECPMTFQWYHEDVAIPEATEPGLTLTSVRPADTGDYSVEATNAQGTTRSNPARLEVSVLRVMADGEVLQSETTVQRPDQSVITMATEFTGGLIFYTTDGSLPDVLSSLYTTAFTITSTTVIRALAYSVDFLESVEGGPYEVQILPGYTLTTSVTGQGSVTKSPNKPRYLPEEVVTLTASPSANWHFGEWVGDLLGSASPATIVMDGSKTVTAVFELNPRLTTGVNGQGTITRQPDRQFYAVGEEVTLTAAAAPGWRFREWVRDATGTSETVTVTMDADREVVAVFDPIRTFVLRTLTAVGDRGVEPRMVTGFTPSAPRNDVRGYRGMKLKTGTAAVEVTGLGRVYMNGNSQDHELVLVHAGSGVTVASAPWTPAGGVHNQIKYVGLSLPVTLAPDTEYYLASAEVIGGDRWYSYETVVTTTAAVSVLSAAYNAGAGWVNVGGVGNSYVPVSLGFEGGGVIQGNTGSPYPENTVVNLTAVPFVGSQFIRWRGDAEGTNPGLTLTMDRAKEVEAVFGTAVFTTAVGGGRVELSPLEGPYAFGSQVLAIGVPDPGKVLGLWGNAASGSANPLVFTVKAPTPTISAAFASQPADKWLLSVAVEGVGLVTLDPPRNLFAPGESVTVTAIPNAAWAFERWTGASDSSAPSTTLVMDGNKSLTARFVPGFRLQTFVEGLGSIQRSPDLPSYLPGQTVELSVTPEPRWVFSEWSGDGSGTTSPLPIVLDADKSVTAVLRALDGAKRWEFLTGSAVHSSPAIGADGTVYVGSKDGKVYALEGQTGVKRWDFLTAGPVNSSPAIGEDGTVYVGSGDGKVYALDGPTGAVRWQSPTGSAVESSPAIGGDGTVYVGSQDKKIYALDGLTGAVRWRFSADGVVRSSPAIGADGTVYVGSSDRKVYALDGPTGTARWQFSTGGGVYSSPAIGADGTVCVSSADRRVYALDAVTGAERWRYSTGGMMFSSPAIGVDGTVYACSGDGKVHAIDGTSGAVRWVAYNHDSQDPYLSSSPAIGDDGTVLVGSASERLYAFDGQTGATVWEFWTGSGLNSSPAISEDGILYIGADDGRVFAVAVNAPLAGSPWPMFRKDARHTGRSEPPPANRLPVLAEVSDLVVDEGALVEVALVATDPDLPPQQLTYALVSGPPGATVEGVTGALRWQTDETHGGQVYGFEVRVTDNGEPPLSDTETFTITVNEVNTAPVLAPVADAVVAPGDLFEVTVMASDADLPANTLSYAVVAGPPGATVEGDVFRWQTTATAANQTYLVSVRVTDDGVPPLSGTVEFRVTVGLDMVWQTGSTGVGVKLWGVEWGADKFVAVGGSGTILTSADGESWAAQSSPTSVGLWGLKYGAGGFVVAGSSGVLLTSGDGVAWVTQTSGTTEALSDVAYGTGRYVVVGANGTILTSEGATGVWTRRAVATAKAFQDVTYGGGYFLASGAEGLVATSPDGIGWTVHSSGTTAALPASGYGVGQWWVGGVGGVLRWSANRSDWQGVASGVSSLMAGLGYGHGRLLAAGGTGSGMNAGFVQLSRDGATWERALTGVIPTLYDIAFNGERWVAVGEGGAVVRSAQLLPPWALEVEVTGLGEVQRAPDGVLHEPGVTVTLTAVPEDGWVFAGWSGDLSGTANPAQVVMNGDRSVRATFHAVNRPPVLAEVSDLVVEEGALVEVALSATDPDLPPQQLTYALVSGPPGTTVEGATGALSWQTGEAEGGQVYGFEVRVTDNGEPPLSDTETFTVTVNEVNTAPVLGPVADAVVAPGDLFEITLMGSDADLPANVLVYALVAGPPGATVEGGVFRWQTAATDANQTYLVRVQLTDDGVPPLSAMVEFNITVGLDMVWQTGSTGVGVKLWGVEWGGDKFVAVGGSGTILTSADGESWAAQSSPTSVGLWGLKYGAGGFVVAGSSGVLLTSGDGVAWVTQTSGTTEALSDVAYGTGRYVVVGANGTILTSDSGTGDWTPRAVATTKAFQDITYGGGYFLASGAEGLVVTSPDGIGWTVHSSGTTAALPASGYGGSQWWVGGVGGVLRGSANRSDWQGVASGVSSLMAGLGYGHGRLLAVGGTGSGMNGGFVQLTRDGATWGRALTGVIPTLYDIAFNGARWVAVGEGGAVVRSMQLLPPWALEVTLAGLGAVQRDPEGVLHAAGVTVTLTAVPEEGWVFAGWSGDLSGEANPAQVVMNGDREVGATFQAVNRPPVMAEVADLVVDEGSLVEVGLLATDPDLPPQQLTYALVSGPPGATVDGVTGALGWQTDETHGGQVFAFEVRVTDNGEPPLSDTETFTITVNEVSGGDLCRAWVTSFTPGTMRNNVGGYRGMKFRTGAAPVQVVALGRVYLNGNNQSHGLILETSAGVTLASLTWTPAGGVHNQTKYVNLATPVTLAANTDYYLASAEGSGGDSWYNYNSVVVTTPVASALSAAYKTAASWVTLGGANNSYVPVSFCYAEAQPAEIEVRGDGAVIADGDTSPSMTDDTDFGSTCVGTAVSKTYTVQNVGGSALTTGGLTVPAGYTVTEGLSASIAAGGQDTFTVRLDATAAGTFTGDVSFTNNDSDENPFNFRMTGTVTDCASGDCEDGWVSSFTPGTLRNNVGGYRGLRLQVGASALRVCALGRVYVNGNSQLHELVLADSAGTVLASVTWTPAGGVHNQMRYVDLGSPVTLSANTEYYLGSAEVAGGDSWYNFDTVVSTTPEATVLSAAYNTGSGWVNLGGANQSYVPVSLRCCAGGPCTDYTGLVTGLTPGALRNNVSGYRGLRLRTGAQTLQVSALGRVYVNGNSQNHALILAQSDGAVLATATWTPAGGVHNAIKYQALAAPVTLAANTEYYLGSAENAGGDSWYNFNTMVTPGAGLSVLSAAYNTSGSWVDVGGADNSYVPVSIWYCAGGGSGAGCTDTDWVTGITPGALRNNVGGYRGLKLRTGAAPVEVTGLGRVFVNGNSQSHELVLVHAASGVTVASATWTPAGGVHGRIKHMALAASATLAANTEYYLGSAEISGGDSWYNFNTVLTTTGAASVLSAAYNTGASWVQIAGAENSYVPVGLQYCAPNPASGGSPASGDWMEAVPVIEVVMALRVHVPGTAAPVEAGSYVIVEGETYVLEVQLASGAWVEVGLVTGQSGALEVVDEQGLSLQGTAYRLVPVPSGDSDA